MAEAVIVSALRTPIGTARKGTLRDTSGFSHSLLQFNQQVQRPCAIRTS
ncbi:hypothetical protein MAHJHV60_46810 [Mycobacterium avium subsp. hominissuis]